MSRSQKLLALISMTFVMTMLISMFAITAAHADPAVHEISTCTELKAADDDTSTDSDIFILTANIDCHGVTFTPLNWNNGFHGTFNGDGYTIRNLTITSSTQDTGLFATVRNAQISSFNLRGGSVTGTSDVGALAGEVINSDVSYIHSDLDVTGTGDHTGGMIGIMTALSGPSATVDHLSTSGTTTGPSTVGGLFGYAAAQVDGSNLSIRYSFATGEVNGGNSTHSDFGGLIGIANPAAQNDSSSIQLNDSFASGDVTASHADNVGGLIGRVANQSLTSTKVGSFLDTNTYASGNVVGSNNVGGLIGYAGDLSSVDKVTQISNSFATGDVVGDHATTTGGFIGTADTTDHGIDSIENHFVSVGQVAMCTGSSLIFNNCTAENSPGDLMGTVNPVYSSWDFDGDPWYLHDAAYPTLTGDDDFDGVADAAEDDGPNQGDGNHDGILDSTQPNVATLDNSNTEEYVTVISPSGTALQNVQSLFTDDVGPADPNHGYPWGFVSFAVQVANAGDDAAIKLFYHSVPDATDFAAMKYIDDTYTEIPGATYQVLPDEEDNRISVDYTITDGDSLDSDATENALIVDPVGLGINGILLPADPVTTTVPGAPTTTVVPAVASAGASGALPTTGTEVTYAGMFAVLVLLAGAGIAVTARKRRLLGCR